MTDEAMPWREACAVMANATDEELTAVVAAMVKRAESIELPNLADFATAARFLAECAGATDLAGAGARKPADAKKGRPGAAGAPLPRDADTPR